MDNPQPAGQLPVALPLRGPMGAAVRLGVRGRAQLALHHLHPVPHRVLEEEPPAVRVHTGWGVLIWQEVNFPSDAGAKAPRGTAESVMCSRTHWCDMYKQCHSVVTRLFGLSAGLWSTVSTCVTGWWFISSLPPPTPRGKQPGPLLHMHVRVHVYVCRIWTLSEVMHCFVLFLSRLNLRELGPWTCHMRWLVWVMASFGTTYVFFFHERSVCAHPVVLRTSIVSNAKKQQRCVFILLIISKKNSRNKTHLFLFPASCPAKTAVSFYVTHVCKMILGGVSNLRQVSCIACWRGPRTVCC